MRRKTKLMFGAAAVSIAATGWGGYKFAQNNPSLNTILADHFISSCKRKQPVENVMTLRRLIHADTYIDVLYTTYKCENGEVTVQQQPKVRYINRYGSHMRTCGSSASTNCNGANGPG